MIETLKQMKSEIQPLVGADVTERNALNEIEFKLMQLIALAEQPAQREPLTNEARDELGGARALGESPANALTIRKGGVA